MTAAAAGTSPHRLVPDEYLVRYDILHYFEDAVVQLLRARAAYPTKAAVHHFFAEYFRSVQSGHHVLFREFSFIMATQHSRRSFVRWLAHCLDPIAQQTGRLSVADYHNVVKLLCKDFPLSIVKASAAMLVVEDGLECLLAYKDFIKAFKLRVVFTEFLDACRRVFQECLAKTGGAPVPMGSFLQGLLGVFDDATFATIPLRVVETAVRSVEDTSEVQDVFNSMVRCPTVIESADSC